MSEGPDRTRATDPRRIFESFQRHGVEYIIIGGVAAIAHGHTRNTRDVDFVAPTDPANLERLAAALRELGARLSGTDAHLLGIDVYDPATLGSGAKFTMETDAGGLDFFNDVPGGAPYDDLRRRALVIDLGGLAVQIAGRDDLIRMKQAAGRPQDLADIAALTAGERGAKD
jgi:predicted nucleotidyltransferase